MPKKKTKKVNPHRRPATQADVDKAKEWARDRAVSATTAIVMFVLREKFGFGKKRLTRFWDEVNSLSEDVISGAVKVEEIEEVLLNEYEINLM